MVRTEYVSGVGLLAWADAERAALLRRIREASELVVPWDTREDGLTTELRAAGLIEVTEVTREGLTWRARH